MKNIILVISILITSNSFAQTLYIPKEDKQSATTINKNLSTDNSIKDQENPVNTPVFDKKNSLKMSLISPFIQTFTLFYTRYLNEEKAIQLGISTMNEFTYSSNKFTITSQAFTIEYRYLLSGTHGMGSYIQPFSRTINFNSTVAINGGGYYDYNQGKYIYTSGSSYHESCISTGLGFLIGFQNTFKNRILLDMYLGPVYSIQMFKKTNAPAGTYPTTFPDRATLDDAILKNYGARAGLSIGFLF